MRMIDWPILWMPVFSMVLIYLAWKDLKYLFIDSRDLVVVMLFTLTNQGYLLFSHDVRYVLWNIAGALFSLAVFFLLWQITKKKGIGEGEWRIAPLIFINIGFINTLEAMYFSFVLAAIFAAGGLIMRKFSRRQRLPFLPFIALGVFISFFFP